MYERLLVPLDGSVLSESALPYAEELAGRMNSEITLVYVAESPQDPLQHMHELYLDKMAETTKRVAERFLEKRRRSIKVQTAVLVGNAAERIIDFADEHDVGLIVMSTRGLSGIKRWAIGSVADKVVRATTRPTLLVRGNAATDARDKGVLSRVLVPLDGSREGEAALSYVQDIGVKLKTEITLFQVLTTGRPTITHKGYDYLDYTEQQMASDRKLATRYLQRVSRRLEKNGVLVKAEVRSGNPAEEIIKLANAMPADLVVMSTCGRSGIGRWAFGSVSEKVLLEGNSPILMVRAPKAGRR